MRTDISPTDPKPKSVFARLASRMHREKPEPLPALTPNLIFGGLAQTVWFKGLHNHTKLQFKDELTKRIDPRQVCVHEAVYKEAIKGTVEYVLREQGLNISTADDITNLVAKEMVSKVFNSSPGALEEAKQHFLSLQHDDQTYRDWMRLHGEQNPDGPNQFIL